MTADGRYVYGLINGGRHQVLGPIGIEGREVYTFPLQDIAAVVSHLPYIRFDSQPKETLLRNLTTYQSVIEEVMKHQNIIPIKFGTVVEGDDAIRQILEKGYDQIHVNLRDMENKIELDVVALWADLDAVLKEIGEDEEIKELKGKAAPKPGNEVFEIKIEVGKRVKELLDEKRETYRAEMLDGLVETAEENRFHELMDDSMIMSVAFLIQKGKEHTLERQISQLDKIYQDKINFRIIGPLPPYSFRMFEIKRVDYAEIDETRRTLELGEEATIQEIREAYWQLTKKFHPDKFPGDLEAQKRFEKINKAYKLVNDYCKEVSCSFRESDVKNWLTVRPLEGQRVVA
ncbi:MAG: GvpL/GvpF family gas vesicle protein [Methanosarcinaceae archaeon]|nr:GvpL/GvpF family gas vesicle protein [Methanosarcinaceae archaeon]